MYVDTYNVSSCFNANIKKIDDGIWGEKLSTYYVEGEHAIEKVRVISDLLISSSLVLSIVSGT